VVRRIQASQALDLPGRLQLPSPACEPQDLKHEPASETSSKGKPSSTDPAGAIAKCKDGTYSHAKGHSGACSNHGGVGEWLNKK
jgi:hypothetical protein